MPAFIPVPNTASVEFIYYVNNFHYENVFHVEKAAPFSSADVVGLRTALDTFDNTTWKTLRSTGAFLARIRIKALDTDGSPLEDYVLPAARAGTRGGTTMPLNACICVKLATGLSGRSNRGRMYLGGLDIDVVTNNGTLIVPGYAALVLSSVSALMAAIAAWNAGAHMVVTSYRTGGAFRAVGVNHTVTGPVLVDNNTDSQRRRLPGRGAI